MNLWQKLHHLPNRRRRWWLENHVSISRDVSLKNGLSSPWRYVFISWDESLKKVSPSLLDASFKNRSSLSWRLWQWIYVTISIEMILCFPRDVILKNKESSPLDMRSWNIRQHLHLRDDILHFRIESLEMVMGDCPHISILFHTWLTKWLHELGAKYKSIIVLRWYDGNIDMLRWD